MVDHMTHHDDCGCLSARYEARIAALEAELVSARLDADLAWKESGALTKERNEEAYHWMAHANALRDALENAAVTLRKNDLPHHAQVIVNILAQTPAASLAAHDAEVLERAVWAAQEHVNRLAKIGPHLTGRGLSALAEAESIVATLRALAAQEVTP